MEFSSYQERANYYKHTITTLQIVSNNRMQFGYEGVIYLHSDADTKTVQQANDICQRIRLCLNLIKSPLTNEQLAAIVMTQTGSIPIPIKLENTNEDY